MNQTVIIGAGIVGLATALEMKQRFPNLEVLVLEKEPEHSLHQTGRNSGVIHSGIYYKPGSKKSRDCKEGIELLEKFISENGIKAIKKGKVIVASETDELPELEKIYRNGVVQGIPGVKLVEQEELKEIEPRISGIKAIHLPEVKIIDYRKVCEALKFRFEEKGGKILFNEKVDALSSMHDYVRIKTNKGEYRAELIINCAGLYSDIICSLLEKQAYLKIIPFRGEYYSLSDKAAEGIRGLVYPVPDPLFPFLGIHLTPTGTGKVTAGPNAVLAGAREGYTWSEFNLVELSDTILFPGFWKMAGRHFGTGIFEIIRSLSKRIFLSSVRKFLPDISLSDLAPYPSGVRAQAVDYTGQLVNDFVIQESKRAVHVLNSPSPAATASMSIAKRVVAIAAKHIEAIGE